MQVVCVSGGSVKPPGKAGSGVQYTENGVAHGIDEG